MSTYKEYYSGKPLKATGCMFGLCLSDRSDGKTFDIKFRALENYDLNKTQTVYLRRVKTEITQKMYSTFYNEVINVEKYNYLTSKYEFRGEKTAIKIREKGTKEWDTLIYLVPLTMSGKLKSQIDVQRITEIDYDEFIPLDGRYLQDEMSLLLEFYKSIDRDRYTTQLLIFGNKVTPFNPLFDYFNIDLGIISPKLRTYKNGTLAIEIYKSQEHTEAREKSRFADLIKGTKYEDYSNGGVLNAFEFKMLENEKICKNYWCSFLTVYGKGSIWYGDGKLLISERIRKDGFVITDKIYNIKRQQVIFKKGNLYKTITMAYANGELYFDNEKTLHYFEPLLKMIGGIR